MNSDLPSLPASLVGGRVRPRRLFADPFSSPATSHGEVPEADNEAILMAPLKQRCSLIDYGFDPFLSIVYKCFY